MLVLTVVNRMLATLGEAPLNALTDPHTFRGACTSRLDTLNTTVQSQGWWFNRERLVIQPNVGNSKLYLPGDVTNVVVENRPDVVQRGRVLYDTYNGTNVFTQSVVAFVIRSLLFEELPEIAADYIAAKAVLEFQTDFDGDSNKMRTLQEVLREAKLQFNAEATRQIRYNSLTSNARLQRLKSRVNYARKL